MAEEPLGLPISANDLLMQARAARNQALNRCEELEAALMVLGGEHRKAVEAWAAERRALVELLENAQIPLPELGRDVSG